MSQGNNIKVVARFRPQNSLEIREGGRPVVEIVEDHSVNIIGDENPGSFTFDRAFGMNTSQEDLYDYSIKQTLEDIFNGYNGTVFAYGQTGSGKTFTMMGSDIEDPKLKGIIPRIVEGIFNTILDSPPYLEYTVKVSYIEIYMERIRDLLNPANDNLPIHEDKSRGVHIKGVLEIFVSDVEEIYETMKQGAKSRVVAHTNMNAESSRSHSIFQITIQQKNNTNGKTKSGQLSLVDLAGSEKVGKTGATGQTLEEAKKINKSLSSLGNVINALTDGKSTHIPYRDSKLTRILQESLGGNSRTTLIINCSPSSYNVTETISTLRFGMRAKSITNKATINQALSPEELSAMVKKLNIKVLTFSEYIQSLEGEIKIWRSGGNVPPEEQAVLSKKPQKPASKPDADSLNNTPYNPPRDQGTLTPQRLQFSKNRNSVSSSQPHQIDQSSSRASSPGLAPPQLTFSPTSTPDISMLDLTLRSPTPYNMGDDEREEFLKRENDLTDQLSEKEKQIKIKDLELDDIKSELETLQSENASLRTKNDNLSTEVVQYRLEKEKSEFNLKETQMTVESMADAKANSDEYINSLKTQLDESLAEIDRLKRLEEFKSSEPQPESESERSKTKDERLSEMVSEVVAMSTDVKENSKTSTPQTYNPDSNEEEMSMLISQRDQLIISERKKAEQIGKLQIENSELLKKHIEIENMYNKLIVEYEDFLESSIALDEEQSNKESLHLSEVKTKVESQYSSRIEQQMQQINELQDERQRRIDEINSLNELLSEYKSSSLELETELVSVRKELENAKLAAQTAQVNAFASIHASGMLPQSSSRKSESINRGRFGEASSIPESGSGESLVDSLEKANIEITQLKEINSKAFKEFETVRRSLMRDVQNRCEKIIELEMDLDDLAEKNRKLSRKINTPEQTRKMVMLEKNLSLLTGIQKDLVMNNTEFKKQISFMERKLDARSERIEFLEQALEKSNNELDLTRRILDEMRTKQNIEKNRIRNSNSVAFNGVPGGLVNNNGGGNYYLNRLPFNRVAKPIRGGGGSNTSSGSNRQNKVVINEENQDDKSGLENGNLDSGSKTKNRSSWLLWGNS
ncbi:Kinesin heavy chain [Smittium mucronatum]|uniref:Kinesin heavy chain n=1 Tax=Smittium mucronatum TaxID=133383 RepID=A0A1R0GXT0_9FUNG|nr:Kinesin heavy chain [Smittium mucronatum]